MTRYFVWFAFIGGVCYWAYSTWQDHLKAEQVEEAREARRQAQRHAVRDMAAKTSAVTDWADKLAGGEKVRMRSVMTAELQSLWLNDRPVLFIGSVRDVAINTNGTYQVTVDYNWIGARHMFLENEIRVSLVCPESFAKKLIHVAKAGHVRRLSADAAVIARIDRVEPSTERGGERDTVNVLTGIGECVNAMHLSEHISW
jgi:hypothetical protein